MLINESAQHMKKQFDVLFYETKDGKSNVKDFLDSLDIKERARVLAQIAQLKQEGPQLPRPYADILRDGIHELRVKMSGNQYRMLYFFCYETYIVITHNFIKTTQRVPEEQVNMAIKCREDFLRRNTIQKLDEEIKKLKGKQ